MRRSSLLLFILLGLVPAIALMVIAVLYLDQDDSPPPPTPVQTPPPPPEPTVPPVEVLAAARDLSIGTLLTANEVTYVPIEPTAVFFGHMRRDNTELSAVIGAVVRTALLAGTPLTSSALVRPGQDGFLATVLTPNHRAITIMVNPTTSHAGLISPGDRVDVIFTMQLSDDGSQLNTFSRMILENIRVVAVNRRVESVSSEAQPEQSERQRDPNTATLEVLPSEADRLVLATTRGSISLALRPLSQAGRVGWRPPVGLRTLLPPPATKEPNQPQVQVRVFRGNSREDVLLAK